MAGLQDRIMGVLSKPERRCVWPTRRAIDRLFIDDMSIPQSGLRMWWALRRLEARGMIRRKGVSIGISQPGGAS